MAANNKIFQKCLLKSISNRTVAARLGNIFLGWVKNVKEKNFREGIFRSKKIFFFDILLPPFYPAKLTPTWTKKSTPPTTSASPFPKLTPKSTKSSKMKTSAKKKAWNLSPPKTSPPARSWTLSATV